MFLSNIRFYILLFSFLLTAGLFIWGITTINEPTALATKLDQLYGLGAISFLYLTLLVNSITKVFPGLKFKTELIKSQMGLGLSILIFAIPHVYFSFFKELGGFEGLGFLNNKYLLGIGLGLTSLVIICLLALIPHIPRLSKSSFFYRVIKKLIYLAGLSTVTHAFLFGSQFTNYTDLIPQILFGLLIILLILKAIQFDNFLKSRFNPPNFGISLALVLILSTVWATFIYLPDQSKNLPVFNVHAVHIQLAQQAQRGGGGINTSLLNSNNPSLQGDPTRRFTASFLHSDNIQPNQDTILKFRINEASSGNPIGFFLNVYAYPMHLMIVDSSLSFFEHIHPTQHGNEFDITTKFPKFGLYHLYIQYQPLGAIEQQMAFTLPVGINENDKVELSSQPVDTNTTKIFSDYEVTLDTHGDLKASDMSLGKDTITFTIKDSKTKQPITTLKPFMASFGHLTMINETTYDFIHVHPNNIIAPPPDANGGPTVDFLPIGIYGPFKPGIYRAFGEFSTKIGTDFDTDFTVDVK